MSKTVTLDETVTVNRPLHEVFAYVSEFSRIEEWDPGVASGKRLTPGEVCVGSEFRIDMKAGFSLHYTVIQFEQDSRMLMTVDSRVFTAREEISFTATEQGTAVRYVAKFDFPLPLAAANRIYPAAMDRVGKSTMAGLKAALEDEFEAPAESRRLALADKFILPGLWRFTRFGYSRSRKHWKPVSAYLGDKHAIVTGATSGVGQAAASALAELGAHVTLVARDSAKAEAVARDIRRQTGNEQVSVELCDLGVIAEVHALADRLLAAGKPVDMLVNNATYIHHQLIEKKPFWEKELAAANILDVGLRSAYVASWHAAQIMVPQKSGVIAFGSSFGANCYMHGPAYGAQKAGIDKFAHDMEHDLRGTGVIAVSIWMGPLITERSKIASETNPEQYKDFIETAENPEFTAHILDAIDRAPDREELSGSVLIGAEIAQKLGVTDRGKDRPSYRDMLGNPPSKNPAAVY